jgi:hypothetical protein
LLDLDLDDFGSLLLKFPLFRLSENPVIVRLVERSLVVRVVRVRVVFP